MREIGSFSDWTAVPLEAVDGDVVVVRGQRFVMMGGRWHPEIPMPGYGDKPLPPAGVVPPPMPPGPAAGHRHPHVVDHYGDLRVHGDVAIGGKLRVQEIRQPNMGLYKNYESLVRRYPHPCVGMWAVVGDSVPGRIYRCERDGYWLDTGTTGGGGTFDVDEVRTEVEEVLGAYDKDLSDLQSALNNEAEVRQGGDMALQARVADLQAADDELKKIVRGDETVANAWKNPFVDLGNYATQGEVNAKLNSVYHANDMKYNGLLRISRNGAVMQVSQHGIKTTGDEWYWAQCVAGMVHPSGDGTALDASQKFGICVRWTDYLGNATPWQTYAGGGGDIQLKTINGQSLKGEGNIEISAEGSITIDDVVSETSANAVSSRAVAHAIADVVNALQALVSSVRSDVSALDGRVSAIEAGGSVDVETIRTALNQLQNAYTANKEVTDQRLALVESKTKTVRECVGAFVGTVPSATVQALSHSGSGGEIVYVQNDGSGSPQFAKRVAQSGGGYIYYNNWDGASAFKDYTKGTWWAPREDSVYIDTAADKVYTYDASTMSLKQVTGGSTAADTTIDINSKNAVANSAVARVLNTQQESIDSLQADVTRIESQGVPSTVQGDEVTVSGNSDGGSAYVRLADIKTTEVRGEQQEVVKVRSVGTTHVTDATMPAGSSSEGNMRYKLYNDVTTGNNGAETITLAAGSKLEPAGGVPGKAYGGQGEQITVDGGELSWVHSSDIGMVQDDESLSAAARQSRGVKNADILRMVAASRWNLILDGRYYVYIDSGGTANAVQLWRVLRIQGGCLVVRRHLFTLRADRQLPGMSDAEIAALRHGGLVCDGVEFVHETSGKMIHMNPDGGLLECCELRGCTFRGDGQFITGTGGNVVPTSVTGLKYRYSPAHCKEWLGWTDNLNKDSRYKYARDAHTLYVYPYGTAAPSADALSRDDAESVLSAKLPIYIPYTGGEYVFRVSASGALKYKGSYGNFILQSDAQQGDTLYQENGAVVVFTTLDVCDTMVNGVITRNANPPVDIQGARRVVVESCSFLHDASVTGNYGRDINFDALPVTEEYVVRGCRFENVRYEAINVGAANERESADEWTLFCCPMVVDGNVFRGWPSAHSTSSSYYCAMVGELETVYFTNNLVERFIGRCTAVYDVYFSCAKVYYRHNTVRNVLPFMAPTKEQLEIKNTDGSYKYTKQSYMSGRLYGYMKAKNNRIGIMLREKEDGNKENPSKPLVRVFEDSKFDCDIKEVRKVCEEFLREWQDAFFSLPDLFPDGGYADVPYEEIPLWAIDRVLEKYVMHTSFPNMTSEWGLSEYTVRGNVWDMPGVRMHGAQVSSGWAVTGRWTVDGNYLRMKSFVSSRADGYDRYLFALWPLSDGSTRVSICGNTFVSDGGEVINLLGLSKEYELGELRMENNRFENCGWRISPRRRSLGEGTDRYDGPVTARELSIRGNDEGDGLDDGWELNPLTGDGLYANNYTLSGGHQSMFYVPGVPHLYIGHGNIELWDSQKNGVAANATKCVLLPRGGKLTLRSHHWCRPCPKYVGATPDTNPSAATGTHIVTAANSSLLEITDITDAEAGVPVTLICGSTASGVHISKSGRFAGITAEWSPAVGNRIRLVKDADGNFTELGRWANTAAQTVGAWANAWDNRALSLVHGLSAMDPVGYAVTVRYRLKGVWKERKLEMRTVVTSGDSRAVSARGVDGRRMCCQNTSHAMKMWELGGIDEIGLRFLVSSKDINPDKAASRDYYAPTLRLDLFTDARGTQNDPGTEMTVEVSVMTANADIPTSSALDYGDTSLFETFVPKGSVMTAAERTALLTGDRVFWNVAPTEDGGRTYRTLRPVDAGWWCVDPDSGHVVTWKGTAWSE